MMVLSQRFVIVLGADISTIDFHHEKGCTCCSPSVFDQSVMDMATSALAMTVQRFALEDWLESEIGPADITPENDPFLEFELVIAATLAQHSADFFDTAAEEIEKVFTIPRTVQRNAATEGYTARIEDAVAAVEQVNRLWQQRGLSIEDENAISYALGDALTAGTSYTNAVTGGAITLGETARSRMQLGMLNSSKYYTNQFFNTQVMPALFRAIELGVGSGGDNLIFSTIKDVLHERLKTVPYWRVVANAAASRAYHYGVMKTAQTAGRRFYQYHAVLDSKTSDVCWALHGRVWPVADAVNLMDRIAEAEPQEVKTLAPWLRYKDIEPLLSNPFAMDALGVIIPPIHGNCRSTVVLV